MSIVKRFESPQLRTMPPTLPRKLHSGMKILSKADGNALTVMTGVSLTSLIVNVSSHDVPTFRKCSIVFPSRFCSCCKFKNWCHDSIVRGAQADSKVCSRRRLKRREMVTLMDHRILLQRQKVDCCDFSITLSVVIQALLHSGRRYPHGKDFCIFPFFSERKDSEERRKVKTTFAFVLTRRVIQRWFRNSCLTTTTITRLVRPVKFQDLMVSINAFWKAYNTCIRNPQLSSTTQDPIRQ